MKRLYPHWLLAIGIIAINSTGFAATVAPKSDDAMKTVATDKKEAKRADAQKECKVFAKAGYTEESKTASASDLRFIDFAPEYYTHKAKLLIAANPYIFGILEIRTLYLPSYADCVVAYCLTENANRLLIANNKLPWHTVELDGQDVQFSSSDETRYAIRSTTSNNKTPCTLNDLKAAYTQIIQLLITGWHKDPRSYSGYACWAKKQTLQYEDKFIQGLAYKCHLFRGLRLSNQIQCKATNGRVDLRITLKALATFESKLWQLPKS